MFKSFAVAALLGLGVVAQAAPANDAADEAQVRAAIKALVPTATIDGLNKSQMPGFYEVTLDSQVLYVSADGKYLLSGNIWDVSSKRNLTETRYADLRRTALSSLGSDKRIAFPAKEQKFKVTVFTDIDCGYCRHLHQQMAAYNDLGISVDYLFFPRSGLGTDSFAKAVNVWCAADRNAAMTQAKSGQTLETKTCANPIAEEYQLGQKIGVTGTPAVIAEDGTQIGGYLEPAQMLARLEQLKAQDTKAN